MLSSFSFLTAPLRDAVVLANQDEDAIIVQTADTAAFAGFMVIGIIAVVAIFLLMDMVRRIRRTRYREQVRAELAQELAEQQQAAQED